MEHLNVRPLSSLPLFTPTMLTALLPIEGITGGEGVGNFHALCRELDQLGILEACRPFLPSLLIPDYVVPAGITIEPCKDLVALFAGLEDTQLDRLMRLVEQNTLQTAADQNVSTHCTRVIGLAKSVAQYNRAVRIPANARRGNTQYLATPAWQFHIEMANSAKGFGAYSEWESVAACIDQLIDPSCKTDATKEWICQMFAMSHLERATRVLDGVTLGERSCLDIFQTVLHKLNRIFSQQRAFYPEEVDSIRLHLRFARRLADLIPAENRSQALGAITFWENRLPPSEGQMLGRQEEVPNAHPQRPLDPSLIVPVRSEAPMQPVAASELVPDVVPDVVPEPPISEPLDQQQPISLGARLVEGMKDFREWIMALIQSCIHCLRRSEEAEHRS